MKPALTAVVAEKRRAAFFAVAAAMLSCTGQSAPSALDEPVRVRGAQFIAGALPGTAPGTPGPPDLRVTNITSASRVALPGQASKKLDGRASKRASAIGVRFADLGTGYWVFPLGPADPQFPGELTWSAELDFNLLASDTPGMHSLRVVAIDPSGAAGEQGDESYCIASRTPDNLSSCDPKTPPPDAVVSLYWDADLDLDLHVVLPGGRAIDAKHPLSDPNADAGAETPGVAFITRDSLAGCQKDGRRQEDLVWQQRPSGPIDVYAQLADACGKTATTFTVVIYEADGEVPNRHLVGRTRISGRFSVAGESEGQAPPLYVTSYTF
jgi:hypothetical protein